MTEEEILVVARILTFAERMAEFRAIQNELIDLDPAAPDAMARLDALERRFDAYLEGVVTEGVN